MSATVYPAKPTFRSTAERDFFEALLPQLSDDDVVFANLEMTDDVDGEMPESGEKCTTCKFIEKRVAL